MQIETGQGTVPLKTLISIWTISAVISIPGLAISPIMGDLTRIFPGTTDLEIEMLTTIPSLLIIPFIIFSGYVSARSDRTKVLFWGLLIFLICGGLCFFAKSITMLIVLSALIGIGAGMIIPLSTGFIAELFVGERRTAQLGISSAIANLALVVATFTTGWLAQTNWHMPFLVYLLPLFAILMMSNLSKKKLERSICKSDNNCDIQTTETQNTNIAQGKSYNIGVLSGIMTLYFLAGYCVMIVILNLPFLLEARHIESSVAGTLISIFFLAIMTAGFMMNLTRRVLKDYAIAICMAVIAAGLLLIFIAENVVLIGIGGALMGLGYGFIQPFVYDKATQSSSPQKSVITLAYVMAINYLTIVVAPFIISGFNYVLGITHSAEAPFLVSAGVALATSLWAFASRKRFMFKI